MRDVMRFTIDLRTGVASSKTVFGERKGKLVAFNVHHRDKKIKVMVIKSPRRRITTARGEGVYAGPYFMFAQVRGKPKVSGDTVTVNLKLLVTVSAVGAPWAVWEKLSLKAWLREGGK